MSTPFGYSPDGAPPILIVHGDLDNHTPVEDARTLADHLHETSPSTVAYAELPGAQHGVDLLASPEMPEHETRNTQELILANGSGLIVRNSCLRLAVSRCMMVAEEGWGECSMAVR